SFSCDRLQLRYGLARGHRNIPDRQLVRLGQITISQSVTRIDLYSLLERLNRFHQTFCSTLAHVVSALQVSLVRFHVLGCATGGFAGAENRPQVLRDVATYFILHFEDVGRGSFIGVPAPDDMAVGGGDEVKLHAKAILALQQAPLDNATSAESPARLSRIDLFTFENKDRCPRNDL